MGRGGMEWPEELDRNPFSGGMLFYIFGIPESLTPEQLEDSGWGAFAEFTEVRCLLAAAERTYLPTCSLPRTPARFTRSWRGASGTSASCPTARWPGSAPALSGFSGQDPAAVF